MVDYCRTACEELAQETGRKLKYAASPYLADPKDKSWIELSETVGVYANSCAYHSMKLLYAARIARARL